MVVSSDFAHDVMTLDFFALIHMFPSASPAVGISGVYA